VAFSPKTFDDIQIRKFSHGGAPYLITKPPSKFILADIKIISIQPGIFGLFVPVLWGVGQGNKLLWYKALVFGVICILQVCFKRTLINQPGLYQLHTCQPAVSE
jgi:hypothetical protein